MKPSGSSPVYAYSGRRVCQLGVRRRSESHRSVDHELATPPRSRTTWSIERAVRCQLMANPDWPAPIMMAVANFTTLAPFPALPSVDADEDVRRIGDDVEYGRSLLRLGYQCLDVVLICISAYIEMNPDTAKAIAHLVVDTENALNIHVRLERRLYRAELYAAPLSNGGNACREAAGKTGEYKFYRSRRIIFRCEELRMVRLDSEH